jgi:histidyl-tRNA synthetase
MNEKIILETAKGFRDFPPEEKILRDKIITKIKNIFEIYGYSPLETPTIEKLEILEAKFGAGEDSDAISEIYRLKDQGNRDLGLRYEFTFALARFVGQNPQLRLPFKRYQIGPVFRDGPIKTGRYREFYQCDVDIVGVKEVSADAEIISLLDFVFKDLNLDVNIEVNDRRLLEEILDFLKIEKNKQTSIIITIDKLKKTGFEGVKKELEEKGLDEKTAIDLLNLLTFKGNNQEKLEALVKAIGLTEGIASLKELFNFLEYYSISFTFLPSLARGLGYYTGPIFEVFLKDEQIMSSSIAGGGRWDQMIGKYLQDQTKEYPATGVAFGLEPIMEIIKKREGMDKKTTADLFIIPIGDSSLKESIKITQLLRKEGINTSIDLLKRNVGKNIEYADKLGITYVGFLGENEIKENVINIKNIKTGNEKRVLISEVKESLDF